jgi:hypothetical protein
VSPRRNARSIADIGGILVALLVLITTFPARAAIPAADAPPDAASTLKALSDLTRWVRAWDVPAEPTPSTPAVAASVVLRLDGRLIARADAFSPALAGDGSSDPDVLRRAARQALARALTRLNVPNDAMRDDRLRAIADRLSISLELAGEFTLTEPAAWAELDARLPMGLRGVAARVVSAAGSGPVEAVFPETMLASAAGEAGAMSNLLTPGRAMAGAAARAIGQGGPAAVLDPPGNVRDERSVRMYAFRVTHALQGPGDAAPVVLHRGSRLPVPAGVPTRSELVLAARGIVEHLSRRQAQIDPADRALLALVFDRARRVPDLAPHIPPADNASLVALMAPGTSETLPGVLPLAIAAADFADPALKPHRERLLTALRADLLSPPDASRRPGTLSPEAHPVAVRPVLILAALRLLPPDAPKAELDALDAALRRIYAGAGGNAGGDLSPLMPWLIFAERELQARRAVDDVPAAVALRDARARVWTHQLTLADTDDDTLDLTGGIVFTAAGQRSTPLPTWLSSRAVAFAAGMLADTRLTDPAERPRETVRLVQALRFLLQLQTDEVSAWAYAQPTLAKGGIRAAPWDFSQPLDASALTLLAIAESIAAIDALSE